MHRLKSAEISTQHDILCSAPHHLKILTTSHLKGWLVQRSRTKGIKKQVETPEESSSLRPKTEGSEDSDEASLASW